ncbi:MAG: fibronectin type III domain-containing protein [Candidatus Aminicenantia bacterium]
MKKKLIILGFLFLIFISCGRKAPLLPPIIRIPQEVSNLSVSQSGTKIILSWINPANYIDGTPLSEIEEIQIFILKEKKDSSITLTKDIFLEKANVFQLKKSQFSLYSYQNRFQYPYQIKLEDLDKTKLTLAVKVKDNRNKYSNLSNLVSIETKIAPLPPKNIEFSVLEDKIGIRWQPPEENIGNTRPAKVKAYNLYRWQEEGDLPHPLTSSPIKENSFEDKNFKFDQTYYYFIRSTANLAPPYLESDNSEIIKVFPEDTFPPQLPTGLIALPGSDSVTLIWDSNQEKDLAGYKVWRKSQEEKEFLLLTPNPISENSYEDKTVTKNTIYYYRLTALDKKNNESEKSEVIKVII